MLVKLVPPQMEVFIAEKGQPDDGGQCGRESNLKGQDDAERRRRQPASPVACEGQTE